jgi:hypothetical protein
MVFRRTFLPALVLGLATSLGIAQTVPVDNKDYKRAIDTVTSQSLKGHVAFLASDALAGRGTPSVGLDAAAEYIAAAYRRAGLSELPTGSYFQEFTFEDKKVKNVIGILPGTDPKLKDTYVLVTAHYDHLGVKKTGEGDLIFNGANDNASGTSGLIELASAFGMGKLKPKRTIVFMAFWGEERGLLGSREYAKTPVFPLAKTVADINLEQIGRTDDSEGPRVNAVSVTGADFSTLGDWMKSVGKVSGVEVQKHPQFSDAYFVASDNAALAMAGIPAHTICTAFSFADYHKVGDHWDKLDYANMEKIVKFVGWTVLTVADATVAPEWDAKNPKTQRFRDKRGTTGG